MLLSVYGLTWEERYNPMLGCRLQQLDANYKSVADAVARVSDIAEFSWLDHILVYDCACKVHEAWISRKGSSPLSLCIVFSEGDDVEYIPLTSKVVKSDHMCNPVLSIGRELN